MSDETNASVDSLEKPPVGEPSAPELTPLTSAPAKDGTNLPSLFVSIAALLVSASSFYQAYLGRLYTEDINRPVLITALASEGTLLPKKGWVVATSKVSNVGKMTALQVTEQSFRFSVNGFDDDCFVLAGKSDTKKEPKEILPGGSEVFAYMVAVKPNCLADFSAGDTLPTVNVMTDVTYTDRSGEKRRQSLVLPINAKRFSATRPEQK